jgi:hypothetical protein
MFAGCSSWMPYCMDAVEDIIHLMMGENHLFQIKVFIIWYTIHKPIYEMTSMLQDDIVLR